MIKGVVFLMGSVVALGVGGLSVWLGSRDNNQGEFFDPVTGRWDWGTVAFYLLYPTVLWLLLFALFGGFRRRVER
jgi:hypothetical protein